MKIIVKQEFRDKYDHKTIYPIGKELNFDEERCQDLINRGLAELANNKVLDIEAPEVNIENTELAEEPVKEEKPKRNNKKK